jgi:inosine/xanthosine triphosphatase
MHNLNADLGIGLEGSTFESPMGMMLTGWVAIIDKTGRQGLGGGGGMLLPPVIAQRIRAGEELGPVMDSLTGHANIKHQMGTVGLLSCGTIERTESFRQKVLCALVPFLHPTLF